MVCSVQCGALICLFNLSTAAAGLLLWVQEMGGLLYGAQQQRRRSTAFSSKCDQCHAVS